VLVAGCAAPAAPGPCLSNADCSLDTVCIIGRCATPPACTPTGAEVCGNGVDENCNGTADDACASTCGDGTCQTGETIAACAEDCGAGESRTYAVSTLDVEEDNASDTVFGFDLDASVGGIDGQACTDAMDYVSSVTGAPGVDNQFGTVLAPALSMMLDDRGVSGAFQDAIQDGTLLIILEVSRINGYQDDASVDVHAVLGQVPMGETLTLEGPGLAPGQRFVTMMELGMVPGEITAGRLRASLASLPLPVHLMDTPITVSLHDVVIGARITEAGGLTEGEIGGAITVESIVELAQIFTPGVGRALVESFSSPDLEPDDTGDSCDSVSAGMGFIGVEAMLD
jgi:hypothetical protein